ncbi:OmpA family protein [Nocardia asteroides]|uniref:OmpA family protein n=1 Tax=Nocardia asteroides TaxID=1824 RepID=UPI001E2BE4C6|nr:OmpA family protein [Nocardia asteroides]UGT57003.1 OmpA family protein [Nocardia asteroides]
MKLSNSVLGFVALAAVVVMTAACGSDDDQAASPTTTTVAPSTLRSSVAATASSAASSMRDSAQQTVQDAINKVLAAAPITFDPGSSDLGATDSATLKAVALPLQGNDTEIEITTYAQDSNVATAKSVAKARGDNIAAALEAEGIDKSRISVKSDANPSDSSINADQAVITVVDG